ncbi:MAG: hypothetical protein O7C63_04860 [Alphaproteobacteria bacterium]|nr:hypothetical protein [Alphaproteobacteria bacterium]
MTRPGATRERMLALFVLGLLIFNPPILSLFSTDKFVGGIPLLYFYLFSAWGAFIVLLFLSAGWRDAVRQRRASGADRG